MELESICPIQPYHQEDHHHLRVRHLALDLTKLQVILATS
jgi:hypothetical protein